MQCNVISLNLQHHFIIELSFPILKTFRKGLTDSSTICSSVRTSPLTNHRPAHNCCLHWVDQQKSSLPQSGRCQRKHGRMSHLLVSVRHGRGEEYVSEENHQIADVSKLTEHRTPAGRGQEESVFALLVSVTLSSSPLLCRVVHTQYIKRHSSIQNFCCKQLYILYDSRLISSIFLTQGPSVSTQTRVFPTHVPFLCLFLKMCPSDELLFFVLIES